jgi:hypothetical protein
MLVTWLNVVAVSVYSQGHSAYLPDHGARGPFRKPVGHLGQSFGGQRSPGCYRLVTALSPTLSIQQSLTRYHIGNKLVGPADGQALPAAAL